MRSVLRKLSPHAHGVCLTLIGFTLLIRYPLKFLRETPLLMDFNVYRFAAELVTTGQGSVLYQTAYHEGMLFKYAPIWALLWSPFSSLSTHHGGVLWNALNVGWLVLTLWCAGRVMTAVNVKSALWICIVSVLLFARPLGQEFGNGQANLWWSGLVVLFLYWELRAHPWWAALALSGSILLKLPSAIFLLYFVFVGRWSTLVRTLVWLVTLLIVGALGVDPQHPGQLLVSWVHCLTTTTPQVALRIADQSLFALLCRVLTDDGFMLNVVALEPSTVVIPTLMLDAALFGAIVLPRSQRRHPLRLIGDTALLMIVMVLAAPASWMATYTALLFPSYVALAWMDDAIRHHRMTVPLWLLGGLAGLFNLLTHKKIWRALGIPSWKTETYVYLVFMILPLFGLALFGLLWLQRRLALTALHPIPQTAPRAVRAITRYFR